MLGLVGALVLSIGTAIAIAFVLRHVVLQVSVVVSDSMHPTLHMGDRILVWKIHRRDVRRNDIVVIRATPLPGVDNKSIRPLSSDNMKPRGCVELVKRVAGCPGDCVRWSTEQLTVGDRRRDVASAAPASSSLWHELTLRADQLFLLGDDVARSVDSRHFGAVHTSAVIGRVVARIWPVWRITRF